MSEIQDNVLKPAKLDQYGKTRPIESILPAEIKEKAREYAKTIEHSYADTREELEEDVAEAWAKGFIFCLQGKVEAIYKDKEETIQELTDANVDLIGKIAFTENALNNAKAQIEKMECCENCAFFKEKTYDICHRIKKLGTRKCAFYKMI